MSQANEPMVFLPAPLWAQAGVSHWTDPYDRPTPVGTWVPLSEAKELVAHYEQELKKIILEVEQKMLDEYRETHRCGGCNGGGYQENGNRCPECGGEGTY